MKVITNDGEILEGNVIQIVEAMRQGSHAAGEDITQYMADAVERVHTQTGVWIDGSSPEQFVAGLIEVGLLQVEHS